MTTASSQETADYARFAIGFDPRDRARLHALIDEVIDSGHWSEGEMTRRFESAWQAYHGVESVATGSWSGGDGCCESLSHVQKPFDTIFQQNRRMLCLIVF